VSALAFVSSAFCTQSQRAAPFTVSGVVFDTNGRPLEGAVVRVRADFIYGRAETHTGPDGRYAISDLIRATYRAEAFIEREYAGGTVCQRIAMPKPTDYNSFPVSQGAVRNFRWQLTGKLGYTNTYLGASIGIWLSDLPRESSRGVEFTLTPTGPLFDGSKGAVIVREAVFKYPASDDGLTDLPLGTYKLSAVLIGKDGRRAPLRIATLTDQTFAREVDLVWRPQDQGCFGGFNSGVQPFMVRLELAR
jgi:Carboxypeptidase regulatory-like domain